MSEHTQQLPRPCSYPELSMSKVPICLSLVTELRMHIRGAGARRHRHQQVANHHVRTSAPKENTACLLAVASVSGLSLACMVGSNFVRLQFWARAHRRISVVSTGCHRAAVFPSPGGGRDG